MATREIDDGHGFFNVQLARLSVRVDALEIVQAIGEVGVLLDFTKNHAGADGVRRSGRNKKSVAGENRQALEEIFQTAVFYGCLKLVCDPRRAPGRATAWLRARAETACHISVLPQAAGRFVFAGEGVVRMNLDGELVGGEQEFYEQRKIADDWLR